MKLQEVFILKDKTYFSDPDFYRYCENFKIGRASIQTGIKQNEIFVISNGKNKGQCYAFKDVGIHDMQVARDLKFKVAGENRSIAIKKIHEEEPKRKYYKTLIRLLDPDKNEVVYDSLTNASKNKPASSLQNVKNQVPYAFTTGAWAGWVLLEYNTEVKNENKEPEDSL